MQLRHTFHLLNLSPKHEHEQIHLECCIPHVSRTEILRLTGKAVTESEQKIPHVLVRLIHAGSQRVLGHAPHCLIPFVEFIHNLFALANLLFSQRLFRGIPEST